MSFIYSEYLQKQTSSNQNCSYFNEKKQKNESNSYYQLNFNPQIQKSILKDKYKSSNYQDSQYRRQQKAMHEKLTKSVQDQNKPSNIKMNSSFDYLQNEQFNHQNNHSNIKKTKVSQNLNSYQQLPDNQEFCIIIDQDEQEQQNINSQKQFSFQQYQNSNNSNISKRSNYAQPTNQNGELDKLWQKQYGEQSSGEENCQSKQKNINESKCLTQSGNFMNKMFFKNDQKLQNGILILDTYNPNQDNNTQNIHNDILSKLLQEDLQLYKEYQHIRDVQDENQKTFNQFNYQSVNNQKQTKNHNNQIQTKKQNKKDEKHKYNNKKYEQNLYTQQREQTISIKDNQQFLNPPQIQSLKDNYSANQNKMTGQQDSLNNQLSQPSSQVGIEKIEEELQSQNHNTTFFQNQIKFIQNNIFTPEKDKLIKNEIEETKVKNVIFIDDNLDSNQALPFIPLPTLNDIIDITLDDDEDENQNSINIQIQNTVNQKQNINNHQQDQLNQNIIETNQNIIENFQDKNQVVYKNIIHQDQDYLQQINLEKLSNQQQTKINQNIQENSINPQNQIQFIQNNNLDHSEYAILQKNLNIIADYLYNSTVDNQQKCKNINTFFKQKQQTLKNIDSLTEEELIMEYDAIYNH
ncbi:hypothetical protein ABPG72_011642 [Tetrahymena utriculariae]